MLPLKIGYICFPPISMVDNMNTKLIHVQYDKEYTLMYWLTKEVGNLKFRCKDRKKNMSDEFPKHKLE